MIHKIYRDDEVILAINGFPYTVSTEDPRYGAIIELLIDEDEEAILEVLSTKGRAFKLHADLSLYDIEKDYNGDYTYMGNPIPMELDDYLRAAIDKDDVDPIVNFIQRLYENPNDDTRKRLFMFMNVNKMPLTDNGCFLAYKAVTEDYMDKHSSSVFNGVGTAVPRMSWSQVDTDPANTCSRGYHACSKEYLDSGFYNTGDRVVTVSIAPEDVGSIPDDYNGSKLRCRQYTVMADITEQYEREQQDIEINHSGGLNPSFAVTVDSWDRNYY